MYVLVPTTYLVLNPFISNLLVLKIITISTAPPAGCGDFCHHSKQNVVKSTCVCIYIEHIYVRAFSFFLSCICVCIITDGFRVSASMKFFNLAEKIRNKKPPQCGTGRPISSDSLIVKPLRKQKSQVASRGIGERERECKYVRAIFCS